jgi:sulfur carrier protein
MNGDEPTIEIRLEGRPHHIASGTTLAALVAALGHGATAVTTAVNEDFVPRPSREGRVLQAGDAVFLFQPIVGG